MRIADWFGPFWSAFAGGFGGPDERKRSRGRTQHMALPGSEQLTTETGDRGLGGFGRRWALGTRR